MSGAAEAGITLLSRKSMGLHSFYYKTDWAEAGEAWRETTGHAWEHFR